MQKVTVKKTQTKCTSINKINQSKNTMPKPNDESRLKGIKTAQDRKDYSIAFFNATNSAIEIIKVDQPTSPEDIKSKIMFWREWFLEQHGEYRALVTEKIGAFYNVGTAIQKMESTTTQEELKKVWLSFSQDERQDPEVYAKCMELIKKYETS